MRYAISDAKDSALEGSGRSAKCRGLSKPVQGVLPNYMYIFPAESDRAVWVRPLFATVCAEDKVSADSAGLPLPLPSTLPPEVPRYLL